MVSRELWAFVVGSGNSYSSAMAVETVMQLVSSLVPKTIIFMSCTSTISRMYTYMILFS